MRIVVLSAALILAGCAERTWSDYGDGGYGGYGPGYGYGRYYPYYGAYPYWYSPYPYAGPWWNDDVRPPVKNGPDAKPPPASGSPPEFRRKREQSRPKVNAPAGAAERRGIGQPQQPAPPRKKR